MKIMFSKHGQNAVGGIDGEEIYIDLFISCGGTFQTGMSRE